MFGRPDPEERPLDEIEAEMCDLSASIAASQGRLLRLMGEFVERGGHERWEVQPPRWVSWKLGLGTGEARRMVALADRLRRLPLLTRACEEGRVAPSVASLMSRVATPETEAELIELAAMAAPSKVERVCRTKARIEADEQADRRREQEEAGSDDADETPPPPPPLQRFVSFGPAEGGGWEIHGWFPSAEGARVQLGLERARMWLRGAGRPPHPDVVAGVRQLYEGVSWADAGLLLAETVLALGVHERRASDRHQVVVHVDVDKLVDAMAGSADPDAVAAYTANGAGVTGADLARIACHSRLIGLLEQAGRPVRIGDPTEVVPIHIERAVLAAFDHMCGNPTCGETRGLELHHVIHRSHGGTHDPDLLIPLCPTDHHAHHAGLFTIEVTDTPGTFRFVRADGTEITGRPPPRDTPAQPLPLLDDASWAHDRPYGDPLTVFGLDVILHRLFTLEQESAEQPHDTAAA